MIIYLDNKAMMSEDFQELSIGDNIDGFDIVWSELYKPFSKFTKILQEISGFSFPSGFALISNNSMIENMYIGQEEASIDLDTDNYKKVLIINNYAGREGGQWIWKGLTQANLERAFNIKFNKKTIEAIGGFPSTITLSSQA